MKGRLRPSAPQRPPERDVVLSRLTSGEQLDVNQRILFPKNRACILCYHVGMKKKARSIQYTIRGVPADVDRALRQKALHRRTSLNEVVVDELVAATTGQRVRAD